MELHSLDGQLPVSQAHDDAVGGLGGDLEDVGQRVSVHDQGVVPGGLKRVGHVGEDAHPGVEDGRGLAVHELGGGDDTTSVDLADALVAEAHTEDGQLSGQLGHHVHAHPAVLGPPRPR